MSPAKKIRRCESAKKTSRAASAREGMLTQSELRRIAERVFKLSDADETEVMIDVTSDALTRFANNTIHQNVAEQGLTISVRTVFGGRTARATTNRTDDESLARVVAASATIAKSQARIPHMLPMPGAQKPARVARFFDSTASFTPQDRAKAVARVCIAATKRKQTVAGIFSSGAMQSALANSRGLFLTHEQTRAEFSVTVLEPDSSGWQKANSPDVTKIFPDDLADRAAEKSTASRKPKEAPPGRYTVILEPAAVLDLVGFLFYDFAGTAVLDQRSCFNKRMGKQVMGPNITIWDDVYHPLQTGAPYDGEGIPRQKVLLVDHGTPRNLVYSRATAKRMPAGMHAKPTGHGFPLPNEYGEAPMNLGVWGRQSDAR